ncbi:MAG TPA: hypothetical protein VD883_00510, partial [Candidatus Omnitrophota bacterium]|nr:hypothetical protein [Candidatus Omnitrophota bacterium]
SIRAFGSYSENENLDRLRGHILREEKNHFDAHTFAVRTLESHGLQRRDIELGPGVLQKALLRDIDAQGQPFRNPYVEFLKAAERAGRSRVAQGVVMEVEARLKVLSQPETAAGDAPFVLWSYTGGKLATVHGIAGNFIVQILTDKLGIERTREALYRHLIRLDEENPDAFGAALRRAASEGYAEFFWTPEERKQILSGARLAIDTERAREAVRLAIADVSEPLQKKYPKLNLKELESGLLMYIKGNFTFEVLYEDLFKVQEVNRTVLWKVFVYAYAIAAYRAFEDIQRRMIWNFIAGETSDTNLQKAARTIIDRDGRKGDPKFEADVRSIFERVRTKLKEDSEPTAGARLAGEDLNAQAQEELQAWAEAKGAESGLLLRAVSDEDFSFEKASQAEKEAIWQDLLELLPRIAPKTIEGELLAAKNPERALRKLKLHLYHPSFGDPLSGLSVENPKAPRAAVWTLDMITSDPFFFDTLDDRDQKIAGKMTIEDFVLVPGKTDLKGLLGDRYETFKDRFPDTRILETGEEGSLDSVYTRLGGRFERAHVLFIGRSEGARLSQTSPKDQGLKLLVLEGPYALTLDKVAVRILALGDKASELVIKGLKRSGNVFIFSPLAPVDFEKYLKRFYETLRQVAQAA